MNRKNLNDTGRRLKDNKNSTLSTCPHPIRTAVLRQYWPTPPTTLSSKENSAQYHRDGGSEF
jgi:hypothetical protein